MAYNPNVPEPANLVQDDIAAMRANFQHLDPLAQIVGELQTVSGLAPIANDLQAVSGLASVANELQTVSELAPYVQALLDSRIVDHNLDVPNPPNGWYVRWENGLQVVFGEVVFGSISLSAVGSVYASPNLTVTLPAAFSTGVYAWHANSDFGLGNAWAGLGDQAQVEAGSIRFRLFGASDWSDPNVRVSFFAIGRWK